MTPFIIGKKPKFKKKYGEAYHKHTINNNATGPSAKREEPS